MGVTEEQWNFGKVCSFGFFFGFLRRESNMLLSWGPTGVSGCLTLCLREISLFSCLNTLCSGPVWDWHVLNSDDSREPVVALGGHTWWAAGLTPGCVQGFLLERLGGILLGAG